MKAFILGTAGHVDHGKTALVRALTGVDTDRWKEEKDRGLTIDIGFARLDVGPGLEVGVVDVPGHEDFVKNMLAGATGVDCLLLVVAADEGPMPQTREHLLIADALGIRTGVVALTKVDRVEDDWRRLARDAVREELRATLGHDRWPILDVSASTGEGLERVRESIREAAAGLAERPVDDVFRMPIDRSFSVPGAGTVVTGTTWSGRLRTGATARVLPAGVKTRVRAIQVHGSERREVGAGSRCALALVGVEAAQAGRGSTVVGEDIWRPVTRFGARVVLPKQSPRPLEHARRVRIYLGTREVMARIFLPAGDGRLEPGGVSCALIECEAPQVARVRDRFVIRFYSPVVTLGGGQVTELEPPARWRDRIDRWEACLAGDEALAIEAAVGLAAGQGLAEEDLPMVTGLPGAGAALSGPSPPAVRRIAGRLYAAAVCAEARRELVDMLHAAHQTNRRSAAEPLESLRAGLTHRFSEGLLEASVAELVAGGEMVVDGPRARLPDHQPRLTPGEERVRQEIVAALRESRLEPPAPDELDSRLGIDRSLRNDLLRLLIDAAEVVAITPEMYVAADVEVDLRRRVRRVLEEKGTAAPADFKEELGTSRKYLIPLLEYMDRIGVTRRVPDGRVLGG